MRILIEKWMVFIPIFGTGACCFGMPLDSVAWPHLKRLTSLLQEPVEMRMLTPEVAAACADVLKRRESSIDVGVCAALLLAWAHDQDSADVMFALLKREDKEKWGPVNGAVSYALGIREIRKTKKDYCEGLCDGVRSAKSPWELVFYANRLWGDFDKQGLEVIYEAGRLCKEEFVRGELLSYIAETDSPTLAKKALADSWLSNIAVEESLEAILDYAGRSHGSRGPRPRLQILSLRKLEETLKKARGKKSAREN